VNKIEKASQTVLIWIIFERLDAKPRMVFSYGNFNCEACDMNLKKQSALFRAYQHFNRSLESFDKAARSTRIPIDAPKIQDADEFIRNFQISLIEQYLPKSVQQALLEQRRELGIDTDVLD